MRWNQALEGGGFLVGKGVWIEFDVEAVREPERQSPNSIRLAGSASTDSMVSMVKSGQKGP